MAAQRPRCVIGDKARRFAQDETAFLANMAQVLGREMDAGLDGSKIVNKHVPSHP